MRLTGGGIYNENGSLNLLNSTVSSNSSQGNGGGIYVAGGTATLNFTTVYQNSGGSAVEGQGGSVTVKNTVIGGNGPNCSGSVSAVGMGNYSDHGDGTCSDFRWRIRSTWMIWHITAVPR